MALITDKTQIKLISKLSGTSSFNASDLLLLQRGFKSYKFNYSDLVSALPDGSTLEASSNQLGVKDSGIDTPQLADNSVNFSKMQDIDASSTKKVIGKMSGNGDPVEVEVITNLATASNSNIPTGSAVTGAINSINTAQNIEVIQFFAVTDNINASGYVNNVSSNQINILNESTGFQNWTDVFPLTFDTNVKKTILRGKYNWNGVSDLEEMQFVDIFINWDTNEIHGSSISNYESETRGFLNSTNFVDNTLLNFVDYVSFRTHAIAIEFSGKSITKFPWPKIYGYLTDTATIIIENYY